jgi:hypothetical protein
MVRRPIPDKTLQAENHLTMWCMPDVDEEYFLFVRRCAQFHHIWTIYFDLLSGRYVPSIPNRELHEVADDAAMTGEMVPTLMFLLHAFFFSLIEDSSDGIDAFRIWRLKFPDEDVAITALERQIAPMRGDLRVFRNRLGFRGSRSLNHEVKGFDLFGNQSGTKMIEAMGVFKSLNAALICKDLARQRDSTEEMANARSFIDTIPARADALAKL